jgi:hypothetical protein
MQKSVYLSQEAITKIENYRKRYNRIPSFSQVLEQLILKSDLEDLIRNQ